MFIMSKQKDELLKNPLYEILVFPVDGMNIAAIPFSEIIFSRKETESEYIFSAKISKDQIEKFYDYHGSVKGITVYAANKIFPGIEFLAKFVLKRTDDAYKKINISGYGKEINVHLSKLSHLWSVDVNVIGEEEKRSESMNKEIQNGAYALIRKTDSVDDGDIAVVLVNGYDATLKVFNRQGDFILLEPMSTDSSFKTQVYGKDTEIKIIGKYIGKMEMK